MSLISEDYIRDILTNVAISRNIKEWTYSRKKFEAICQNYFGVLIPVDLIAIINGQEENIPLVLKLAPTEEIYRVSGAVTLMFAREIFIYASLLEKYQEHQHDLPLSHQLITPKCYFTRSEVCKEAIVMQNMCGEGYKPYTNDMFLDLNHVIISLNALAKLHALSFILRERDVKMFEEAKRICLPLTERVNKRFMDILSDRLQKAGRTCHGTKYVALLHDLKLNCGRFVESAASGAVNETCICHGDIWKENILYRYMDNQPVSACLIDYQTCRMCSPAFDVLFLIITSTDADLRNAHFDKLLDIYYESFDQSLSHAKLESQNIYSRQAFEEDLKVVGPACFIVANTALWLSCGLQEEGHVRSKQVWSTEEAKAAAIDKYKTIITGILDDFCMYNYLCI